VEANEPGKRIERAVEGPQILFIRACSSIARLPTPLILSLSKETGAFFEMARRKKAGVAMMKRATPAPDCPPTKMLP
jgi:hypothetical protein